MIFSIILTILSLYIWHFLAGRANGLMDTMSFHWFNAPSRFLDNPYFWNPDTSWRNKWKLDDFFEEPISVSRITSKRHHWWYLGLHTPKYVERFPFSSTLLVFLTDGWHLLKTWMILCFCIGSGYSIVVLFNSLSFATLAKNNTLFFLDYWWIILVIHTILCRIAFGIGFSTRYK